MVIAVFQGSCNTGGYDIKVTKIIEKDKSLEVHIKETRPKPGAFVPQVFTSPHDIVGLKKVEKKVIFKVAP